MTPKTTVSEHRTALFPGSFNPFTAGHYDIALRALELFDELVIGVGVNFSKAGEKGGTRQPGETLHEQLADERICAIARLFKNDGRVRVMPYSGLTAEFAREVGACAIIRGIRSVKDFEYERDMADINGRIAGIDTVLLLARPELAAVSSSVVRELAANGYDVEQFMPSPSCLEN